MSLTVSSAWYAGMTTTEWLDAGSRRCTAGKRIVTTRGCPTSEVGTR